ncbi:TrmH family RNA methyltransferase [Mangrovibacterium sp.]|uniref:TrmH family RNA methyltransferase n=1 Tax=Mangrovibacterium sp. TaxID=1961364 RepID=UPI003562495F
MDYQLIDYLSEFITPERNELFERILDQRTRYISIVLENIFQPQNASAAMRSVDCFGLQDAHVIENGNIFEVDREVAMGATKWLNVKKYNQKEENSLDAIRHLRKQGYRIVATTPHEGDTNLEDFDLRKGKVALFFGTELTGISEVVKEEADEFLKIPMYGFTESFNISVSAAVILHHLTLKMRSDSSINWQLTKEERAEIKLCWLRRTIKSSDLIEEKYHMRKDTNSEKP